MTSTDIVNDCLSSLNGTIMIESWGEKQIFYNPNHILKRGVYIITIKESDGDNDKASNLNRDNAFRVNLGIRKETFKEMFSCTPIRPPKGGIIDMEFDFTEYDKVMPHPVYGWMSWICVLNPSDETYENLRPLIKKVYDYALEKFTKRKKEININENVRLKIN